MVSVIPTCRPHDAGKMSKQEVTDGISAARQSGFADSFLQESVWISLYTQSCVFPEARGGGGGGGGGGRLRAPLWPRRHKGPERCSFILINRAFLTLIPSLVVRSLLGGKSPHGCFSFFYPTWFFASTTARHYPSV